MNLRLFSAEQCGNRFLQELTDRMSAFRCRQNDGAPRADGASAVFSEILHPLIGTSNASHDSLTDKGCDLSRHFLLQPRMLWKSLAKCLGFGHEDG